MAEKVVIDDKPDIDAAGEALFKPVIEEVEAKSAKKPVSSEIEGIEELRASLKAKDEALKVAERARNEAEQARLAAERQAYVARNEIQDSNLREISTGMETLKANATALKAAYAAALRAGDVDQAAEINEQIADNRAKYLQLENGQQALKERPKAAPPAPSNDVEAAIARMGIKGRSADWIRSHPEFVRSQAKLNAMVGAHNIAVSAGVEADTDAYFAEVERVLGLDSATTRREDSADDDDPMAHAAQPVARRSSPPAAPVTRSGAAPGKNPRTIRLTPQEVEIAELNKMTPEEYYKQKQRAIEAGEITRH